MTDPAQDTQAQIDESRIFEVTVDDDGIAVLSFNMLDRPMNVMSPEARIAFAAATDRLIADEGVTGIVITSARGEFIAGADLKALVDYHRADPNAVMGKMALLRNQLRRIEQAGKPLVAAMPGTALGGGLEIALACHRRIAVAGPKTVFGLPEVGLGLLPGAGGTQRLTRLIGVAPALPLLLEGTRLSAQEAHKAGFIDEIVSADALLETAKAWIKANPTATQPWDRKGFAIPGGGPETPENHALFRSLSPKIHAKTLGKYPAPTAILSCVFEGCRLPIDQGLQIEFKNFVSLVTGDVAQNMIATGFFAMNDAAKLRVRPKDVPKAEIGRIGILGAGLMGAGIAEVAIQRGLDVVLVDRDQATADAAKDGIAKQLDRGVARGRLTAEKKDAALGRLTASGDVSTFAGVDAVIEAVFEDPAVKREALARVLAVTGPNILCASNTSKLPITGLAEAWGRPDRFLGLHFFSPVPRMKLIEVIRGDRTSEETVAHGLDLAKALGKTPILVNDARGFYTSRVVSRYVSEGLLALQAGVAPALIESAGKTVGMPLGPLALADSIGLETMRRVRQAEYDETGAAPGPEFPLIVAMVEEHGRTGRKAGAGFYDYPADGEPTLWPGLADRFPVLADQPSLETMERRYLHVQALEAARAHLDGVIEDRGQADVGSQLGFGFPAWTGGALRWITTVGAERFAEECRTFEAELGDRFAVPDGLVDAFR